MGMFDEKDSPKPGDESKPSDVGVKPAEPATDPKDSTPAEPETLAPGAEAEGVKTGDLPYVANPDGTRTYPEQKPVETVDDPTPQPETKAEVVADPGPQKTDEPVGS